MKRCKITTRRRVLGHLIGAALIQNGVTQTTTGTTKGLVPNPSDAAIPSCDARVLGLQRNAVGAISVVEERSKIYRFVWKFKVLGVWRPLCTIFRSFISAVTHRHHISTQSHGLSQRRMMIRVLALVFSTLVLHTRAFSQAPNQITTQSPYNVANAAYYSGSDCGAKVMAADAAWLGVPVEIDITQACGTSISTAISPTVGHVLKFTQPGTYTLNSAGDFTLAANGGALSCIPGVTILLAANNPMVTVTGNSTSVRGCTLDGGGQTATFTVNSAAPAAGTGIVAAIPHAGIGGSGYNIGDTITPAGTGTGGQLVVSSIDGKGPVSVTGGIFSVTVGTTGSGGSGYHAGDILNVTGGGGTGGQVQVTSVSSSGVFLAGVIAGSPGSGYTISSNASTTSTGGGSGATVNIMALLGQITGLTVSANGTGYTAQTNLSTSTSGTGVGAFVDITSVGGGIRAASIANEGTSGTYNLGDILTLTGGTGSNGKVQVTSVRGGQITGIIVVSPGTGYALTTSPSATSGGGGFGATVSITGIGAEIFSYSNLNTGIQTVSVGTSGGTGYVVGDLLNVTGSGGSVRVTSTSSGAVTGVSVQTSGTTYSLASNVATTAATGPGVGATINITGLQNGITTATIASGGTNYQIGDILNVTGGGGSGGQVQVSSVSGTSITGIAAYSTGSSYSTTSGLSTSAYTGSGTGAIVNITATGYAIVPTAGQRIDIYGQPSNTLTNAAYVIIGATNTGSTGTIAISSTSGFTGSDSASYVWTAWNGFGISLNYVTGFNLQGTTLQNQDRYSLISQSSSDIQIIDNNFTSNVATLALNGGGSNNLIQGNVFSPPLSGTTAGVGGTVFIFSQVGRSPTNLAIVNNAITAGQAFGITAQATPGQNITGYLVKGNAITAMYSPAVAGQLEGGISVFGDNVIVEGNTYTNLTGKAPHINALELGLTDSIVSNNVLMGGGMTLYSGHNKVIGNHVKTLQANYGLNLQPNYGFTDLSYNLIENNEFSTGSSPWTWSPGAGINGNYTFLDSSSNCASGHCFQMYVQTGITGYTSAAPTWSSTLGGQIQDGTAIAQNVGAQPPSNYVALRLYCLTNGSSCIGNTISNNTFVDGGLSGHTAIDLISESSTEVNDTYLTSNHFTDFSTCYAQSGSNVYNTNVWWNDESGCTTLGTTGSGYIGLNATLPGSILPTATSSALGLVKPDNSTITISGGVLTSTAGGGNVSTSSSLTPGTIPVATGSAAIANSSIVDNGTNTTIGHPLNSYNGIALVGGGVPIIIASADLTGLNANISNYTIYSVPASPTYNYYRVCEYGVITTAATTSSTLPSVAAKITDPVNSIAVAVIMGLSSTVNTTSLAQGGCTMMHPKAGTPIYLNSTGYASSGATQMVYEVHSTVEALR